MKSARDLDAGELTDVEVLALAGSLNTAVRSVVVWRCRVRGLEFAEGGEDVDGGLSGLRGAREVEARQGVPTLLGHAGRGLSSRIATRS